MPLITPQAPGLAAIDPFPSRTLAVAIAADLPDLTAAIEARPGLALTAVDASEVVVIQEGDALRALDHAARPLVRRGRVDDPEGFATQLDHLARSRRLAAEPWPGQDPALAAGVELTVHRADGTTVVFGDALPIFEDGDGYNVHVHNSTTEPIRVHLLAFEPGGRITGLMPMPGHVDSDAGGLEIPAGASISLLDHVFADPLLAEDFEDGVFLSLGEAAEPGAAPVDGVCTLRLYVTRRPVTAEALLADAEWTTGGPYAVHTRAVDVVPSGGRQISPTNGGAPQGKYKVRFYTLGSYGQVAITHPIMTETILPANSAYWDPHPSQWPNNFVMTPNGDVDESTAKGMVAGFWRTESPSFDSTGVSFSEPSGVSISKRWVVKQGGKIVAWVAASTGALHWYSEVISGGYLDGVLSFSKVDAITPSAPVFRAVDRAF